MYQKIIDNLIREIPCKVHICSYKKIKQNDQFSLLNSFINYNKTPGFFHQIPIPEIFVYKCQPIKQLIYVLLHEYGHYQHRDYYYSNVEAEVHADIFALNYLLKHNYKSIIKYAIKILTEYRKQGTDNSKRAITELMKTKTWQKALIFAEK